LLLYHRSPFEKSETTFFFFFFVFLALFQQTLVYTINMTINIKQTLILISTCFTKYIQATNLTDLPHLIHDAASKAKVAAATIVTSDQQRHQQIMQILTSISGAIKLSWSFFKSMFGFLYTCITTILSPIIWILCYLWSQFVTKPFGLFTHVAHVFYPVILFCIAAICCGLFIGGVAGFAAEAFSSILISATWGPQPRKKEEEDEDEVAIVAVQDQKKGRKSKAPLQEEDEDDDEERLEGEETDDDLYTQNNDNLKRSASAASSIWESSSSFFGVHQGGKKEKEPMRPKVELWRDSISASSSVSSATSQPPVLIRRMKLSSLAKKKKLRDSSWEWDEDDHDHGKEEEEERESYHPSSSSKKPF
jgi:hypothetical protein